MEEKIDNLAEKIAALRATAADLSPLLTQELEIIRSIMVYNTNYGAVVDDEFVLPRQVSEEKADTAHLLAHTLANKASATLKQVSLLITRLAQHDIPAAQRACYRALMLKRQAKTCGDAMRMAKLAKKQRILERQAQDRQLLESE